MVLHNTLFMPFQNSYSLAPNLSSLKPQNSTQKKNSQMLLNSVHRCDLIQRPALAGSANTLFIT